MPATYVVPKALSRYYSCIPVVGLVSSILLFIALISPWLSLNDNRVSLWSYTLEFSNGTETNALFLDDCPHSTAACQRVKFTPLLMIGAIVLGVCAALKEYIASRGYGADGFQRKWVPLSYLLLNAFLACTSAVLVYWGRDDILPLVQALKPNIGLYISFITSILCFICAAILIKILRTYERSELFNI